MRQLFAGYPDIGELRRNEKEKNIVLLRLVWSPYCYCGVQASGIIAVCF